LSLPSRCFRKTQTGSFMEDMPMSITPYCGCGHYLVGVRRLSRTTDKTSSPQAQGNANLAAAADVGSHIIAWADDWEVSGATDPLTRPAARPVAARRDGAI